MSAPQQAMVDHNAGEPREPHAWLNREKFVEVGLHLYVAAFIFGPLRALGSEGWSETARTLVAVICALLLSFVGNYFFRQWAIQVLDAGWRKHLQSPAIKEITEARAAGAKISDAIATLNGVATRTSEVTAETKDALARGAGNLGAAINVLITPQGINLLTQLQHAFPRSGKAMLDAFLEDHARLIGAGGFLYTMEGYLHYLEKILVEDDSSLICLNKTLPIDWFAPLAEDEAFIQRYTRIALRSKARIRRLTVVSHANELEDQFGEAVSHIQANPSEDGAKLAYGWFMSLLLQILNTEATDRVTTVSQLLGDTFNPYFKATHQHSRDLGAPEARTDAAGWTPYSLAERLAVLYPPISADVWSYLQTARANGALQRDWTRVINLSFRELMGDDGSLWILRGVLERLCVNESLRRAADSHSEVGVFKRPDGSVTAFHSKGDLYAGVVLRLFGQPEDIERDLTSVFERCKTDIQNPTLFGLIGGLG